MYIGIGILTAVVMLGFMIYRLIAHCDAYSPRDPAVLTNPALFAILGILAVVAAIWLWPFVWIIFFYKHGRKLTSGFKQTLKEFL